MVSTTAIPNTQRDPYDFPAQSFSDQGLLIARKVRNYFLGLFAFNPLNEIPKTYDEWASVGKRITSLTIISYSAKLAHNGAKLVGSVYSTKTKDIYTLSKFFKTLNFFQKGEWQLDRSRVLKDSHTRHKVLKVAYNALSLFHDATEILFRNELIKNLLEAAKLGNDIFLAIPWADQLLAASDLIATPLLVIKTTTKCSRVWITFNEWNRVNKSDTPADLKHRRIAFAKACVDLTSQLAKIAIKTTLFAYYSPVVVPATILLSMTTATLGIVNYWTKHRVPTVEFDPLFVK